MCVDLNNSDSKDLRGKQIVETGWADLTNVNVLPAEIQHLADSAGHQLFTTGTRIKTWSL